MDNISLMVMDLLQGSVDGVLLTDLVAKTYIARYPGQLVISRCLWSMTIPPAWQWP